jgi:cytochrome c-type biogenesis protein CcmH/NrfF
MRRLRSSLLMLALAAVALPQSGTQLVTPEIRRVGDKLACKCGACNNTVGNCPMLECHYANPARAKIQEMQKQGASDDVIVASFVKESGLVALSQPPAEGFHLWGYLMPFLAIALGLAAIWIYIKRFSHKSAPVAAAEPLPDEVLARYRDRIDKDLAKLD